MPGLVYRNGFQYADMKQQNRFFLQILDTLAGGGDIFNNRSWLVRSSGTPSAENNPVAVDTINADYKIKGKTRWQPISVVFYDPISSAVGKETGVDYGGAEIIHEWAKQHHDSEENIDGYMRQYKRTINLVYVGPDGEPTNKYWELFGAFFENMNWGSLDLSSDDLVLIDTNITYDYAVLRDGFVNPSDGGANV